jgi:hypothetical protein
MHATRTFYLLFCNFIDSERNEITTTFIIHSFSFFCNQTIECIVNVQGKFRKTFNMIGNQTIL